MFIIQHKSENGFDIVRLLHQKSGCFAEIIPGCAAMLHAFGVRNQNVDVQLIESFNSLGEYKERVEPEGYKGCKLSPFVCRIKNSTYIFGEKKYTVENRSGADHALHGLLYNKAFEIVDEVSNDMHASVSMKYNYKGDEQGYPFKYECLVTWELFGDCLLRVNTVIENKDIGLIPIQDGWHPYFNFGHTIDELELEFQSKNMLVFDNDLIPTGEKIPFDKFITVTPIRDLHFDSCYELDLQECQPLCVLRSPIKKIEVKIFPQRSYPYLQLYTPDDRQSIAVENISGPSDGFNSGNFTTLEPGQITNFATAYQVHFLNHLK